MQTFIKEDVQKYWDTIIKCLFHKTWHIETYECGMFQEMQIISHWPQNPRGISMKT